MFKKVFRSAKNELFIQIYGLTDEDLIYEIYQAHSRGVHVNLLYDPSASPSLNKYFPYAHPVKTRGLMHKKIVIVDKSAVFVGSTNLTPTSLRMHDNLVAGLYSKDLSSFLLNSLQASFSWDLPGDLKAKFYHLPDHKKGCLKATIQAIESAREEIYLALFTFTHPKIVQALLSAKEKGVKVSVALDFSMTNGASQAVYETLKSHGIYCILGDRDRLLHHKWAMIDRSTLLLGSANWTKSAFAKNDDCILFFYNLPSEHAKYMLKLWKKLEKNFLLQNTPS